MTDNSTNARQVAIRATDVEAHVGSGYPEPFTVECRTRIERVLGDLFETRIKRVLDDLFELTQFGVNLTTSPPGAWSAQRHWHERQDEFIHVVEGELVLISDDGEVTLGAGLCAGFPAGRANGHHLVNRSVSAAT